MGLTALNVGEKEFALGAPFLRKLAQQAPFPFLSANLYDRKKNKLLFPPSLLKKVGPYRVGIFGLLAPHFRELPKKFFQQKGLRVEDPLQAARRELLALQQKKADLILLLAHMTLPQAKKLLAHLKGVHFLLLAHQGLWLNQPLALGKTYLLSSYQRSQYLGRLDLYWKTARGPWQANPQLQKKRQTLTRLRNRIRYYRNRLRRIRPKLSPRQRLTQQKLREQLQRSLSRLKKEQKKLKLLQSQLHNKQNTFVYRKIPLGKNIPQDPQLQKIVKKHQKKIKLLRSQKRSKRPALQR